MAQTQGPQLEYEQQAACWVCRRGSRARVCRGCRERVGTLIASLPTWYERLGQVVAPGAAGAGERVRSSRFGQLNVRVEPLSLRAWGGMASALWGWEQVWREELGWSWAPFRGSAQQTVAGCAQFLAVNWPWAADGASEPGRFAQDVHELVAQCRAQVEGPSDTRRVGLCPTVATDGYVCATALYAHPYVDVIECRGCRTRWPRTDWIKLASLLRAASGAQ